MLSFWRVAFLALGSIATLEAVGSTRDLSPSEIFRSVSDSVVTVHAMGEGGAEIAQGSGVVVGREVVVSNCHVIAKAKSMTVGYKDQRLAATLRNSDPERDLCSLNVRALNAPSVVIGSSSGLEVGDHVFAIGAPQGLELTLSDGLISSFRPVPGGKVIQTTAAISHGSSGGGLFDSQGALIGITAMYLKDSQQLNFAVPVEWIGELPQRSESQAAAARDAVNAWGEALQKSDPAGYAKRQDRLIARAKEIGSTFPPDQWLLELMKENDKLKAADEAKAAEAAAQAAADAAEAAQVAADAEASADAAAAAANDASRPRVRWYLLSDEATFTAYWDSQTMEKVDDVMKYWIKLEFKKDTKEAKAGIAEQLSEVQFNCTQRTMRWGAWTNYSKSGKALGSGPDSYTWNKVTPESVGEFWWHKSCD